MTPSPRPDAAPPIEARDLVVSGRVQGVGFRPFVHRIAERFGLAGHIRNGSGKVFIHVEGPGAALDGFVAALTGEPPPLARPRLASEARAAVEGLDGFRIVESRPDEAAEIHLPPDLFCCEDCVAEIDDPFERRYRYPFTNCTQCGPRYTIVRALPYDRPNTSMAGFELCERCKAEYADIGNRRYHAQPLACPDCGPRVTFRRDVQPAAEGEAALAATIRCLEDGGIVAVKGIGGYHLMCDAGNNAAVATLRKRKHRPDKPLAVLFPLAGADGLDSIRQAVDLDEATAAAALDPVRPIVLARRRAECRLSRHIAPGLRELGVFLPYSPLHHILLSDFGRPLVATSGNVSGEPVITANEEAESRLAPAADAFLHHDREIVRPADDSVIRVIGSAPRTMRVGRGLAPLELDLPKAFERPVLAVGGHMKSAIALGVGRRAILSPHVGELDSPRALAVFEQLVGDFQQLHGIAAEAVIRDAHPGYASSRFAERTAMPVTQVQHHKAHASALAGEVPDVSRWLIFSWDGLGMGEDRELWGGETFCGAPGRWQRVASLRRFRLTGGDRAGREPWRSAAAVNWETGRDRLPRIEGADLARQAWDKSVGTTVTSSVGRLFDAAACLVLGVETASFEGQGPVLLESVASHDADPMDLPLAADADGLLRLDWEPLLPMLADPAHSAAERAGIFHASLARAIADQVARLRHTLSFDAVGLTGGVFQNRLLAERTLAFVAETGLPVHLPRLVPANDGGLAFGQLVEHLHADGVSTESTT